MEWLDIRKDKLCESFDIELMFKEEVQEMNASTGESQAKRSKTDDEFKRFNDDKIYVGASDLAEIFNTGDFATRRYPKIAAIYKKYFCRETMIEPLDNAVEHYSILKLNKHLV